MSTSLPITTLVSNSLKRVQRVAFSIIIALGTAGFWLFVNKSSDAARSEAQAIVDQYAPNLESIFVLNEIEALSVALERMSLQRNWLTYSNQPSESAFTTLSLDFPIGPSQEPFGKIYGKIDLIRAIEWQIVCFVFGFLLLIWLLVSFVFSQVLTELQNSVSLHLERISAGLELVEGFHAPKTLETDSSQVKEIEALRKSILKLFGRIEADAKQLERAKTSEAIARTTQSLAHDVRRPFSMVKMVLEAISESEDPVESREIARASIREVNQAIVSVEGMIQDVMQIGSNSKPNQEVASPEAIIDAAINEVFQIFTEANIEIEYNLNHKHCLFIDTMRVGRVFSNILVNAVQAMNSNGNLWIKTKEEKGFIEFRLGNVGSCIPKESLPKLFEAFFTSGKKGGTGLGLAIAQKVINEHDGNIRCESDKTQQYHAGYVEFILTLPISNEMNPRRDEALPTHSKTIQERLLRIKKEDLNTASADELEQEKILTKRLETLPEGLPSILIVDDEAVYRNSLASLITNFRGGKSEVSKIPILFAKNANEGMKLVKTHNPLLIIQDIDLGVGSKNGLEVIKDLRNDGNKARICVHSNRFLFDDQKTAFDAGADSVLPKPMSRAHLFKLISSSLPEQSNQKVGNIKQKASENTKPRIAYIDDATIFTLSWTLKLKDQLDIETFSSTANFLKKTKEDSTFLQSLDVIVTDYYFRKDDPFNGKTFAAAIRKLGFEKPIYLASNGDFNENDFKPDLTGVIGKDAPSFETVMSWIHWRSV